MADAVTKQVVFSGQRREVIHLTNRSDSTGESAVTKVDISALVNSHGDVATHTVIDRIFGQVTGFDSVTLSWDHTTDDVIAVLAGGRIDLDFSCYGGLTDPQSAGGTGDILLTTVGAADGASYDLTIEFRPKA